MKQCKKCLEIKNEEQFYKTTSYKGKNYYNCVCINCFSKKAKIYHKKNKKRDSERRRLYYKNNKEKENNLSKKYNKKNPGKLSFYNKKYAKKIQDKYGLSTTVFHHYGFKTSLFVYKRAKRRCEICGSVNNLGIHHKDKRGLYNYKKYGIEMNNDVNNLQVLCISCHISLHMKERWKKIKKDNPNYNKRGIVKTTL